MFNNKYYFINPITGQIKNKHNKILKGRILREKNKIKCLYYNIKTSEGIKSVKGHRIVAEAVLKKKLTGIIIGHRNGLNNDNRFKNLMINKKRKRSGNINVVEYKNCIANRRYHSIRDFEKITGISHKSFKDGICQLGIYKWEKIYDELGGNK